MRNPSSCDSGPADHVAQSAARTQPAAQATLSGPPIAPMPSQESAAKQQQQLVRGMAKGKASRQPEPPEYPAATDRHIGNGAPVLDTRPGDRWGMAPPWRDFFLTLMILLALTATALIWLGTPFTELSKLGPLVQKAAHRLGLTLTGVVWIVALVGMISRLQTRHKVRQLKAILDHDQLVSARLQPTITETQSGLRMRHVSAWLVLSLGIAAAAVLWQSKAIERGIGGLTPFAVGATISILFALSIAANAVNRLKARRLTRDFRTALNSERLALDTLAGLNVMISACLPTGERTRFNERFLQFVGRTAAQMQGNAWLEAVHSNDRQAALDLITRPPSANEGPREHDMCVRHRSGDFVWLHESLTPRFDDSGQFIEFIATAINITKHVENEAALDKQIGDYKADLARAQAELDELRSEHSKTKTSRNRFEKNLEEAREEVKNLQDALNKSEASLAKIQTDSAARIKDVEAEAREHVAEIEKLSEGRVAKLEDSLRSARQETQSAAAENKKLARAFEKLQGEMAQLRQDDGELREQIARQIKETRQAKAEAAEAHTNEAQHRAKSDRMIQRCEELEAQLATKDEAIAAAQEQAEHAAAAAAEEVERRLHEVSAEALATQLRRQLDGVQRMTSELLSTALDGPAHNAAHNAAATVRTMSELVNEALGGAGTDAAPRPKSRRAAAASFDLRHTVQGVRDLLIDAAKAGGVQLEVEVASNVPAMMHGDDVEIRAALLSLTDAALHLVEDGALTLRLSEGVSTPAHSTIRCELSHGSARIKTDALEAALAIKSTDDSMPEATKNPVAHQAAKAWRTIRSLDGQHGYVLPDEGGFSVWFTFTLSRPAASASLQPQPSVKAAPANAAAAALAMKSPSAPAVAASVAASEPISQPSTATTEPGAAHQMPRVPQEDLNCNLGEVVELGGDSMRVYCAKPPKHNEVSITLSDADMDPDSAMELRAEVVWSKKIAGRKHDVGLKFIGLTPAEQKKVLRIAMQHRKVSTLLDAEQAH